MRCSRCSKDSEMDALYCRFCGTALGAGHGTRPLTRVPANGKIAGVCAGLSAYLKMDVTIVRVAWIVLSIVPGALIGGLLAYIAAWVLMPEAAASAETTPTERLFRSDSDRKVAGVCGGLAKYLQVDSTLVRLTFVVLTIYPGAIIFGVIVYVVAWMLTPLEPPTHYAPAPAI